MSSDILTTIHNKMDSLSKGQKRIAQYILSSYDKAAFLTAGTLGKTVQVSESTVVRFAAELGYEGYPQMQQALQEMVLSRLTGVQRMEVATERIAQEDILSTVLRGDMDRLRDSSESIRREAFDSAVEALLAAKRIYVMGVRSSSALASFLSYYLNYIFEDVHLITTSSDSEVFEQIVRISSGDAIVGISFPRYSSATIQAMKYARAAGATTIALTDSESSPLADHTDCLLAAKSDMVSIVDSLVAPMSVINALLLAVCSRRKEQTTNTFDKLEEIWELYHVYEKIGE